MLVNFFLKKNITIKLFWHGNILDKETFKLYITYKKENKINRKTIRPRPIEERRKKWRKQRKYSEGSNFSVFRLYANMHHSAHTLLNLFTYVTIKKSIVYY